MVYTSFPQTDACVATEALENISHCCTLGQSSSNYRPQETGSVKCLHILHMLTWVCALILTLQLNLTHTHTQKREDGVTLGHRAAEVCLLRIALEGMSFPNYGLH